MAPLILGNPHIEYDLPKALSPCSLVVQWAGRCDLDAQRFIGVVAGLYNVQEAFRRDSRKGLYSS